MRETFRRPIGDGVLDWTLELLSPCPRLSGNFLILEPLYYLPTGPAHTARPTPKNPEIHFVRLQNRIQNFTRFLKAFWLPKWSPKPPKMEPKSIQNPFFFRLRFPPRISSVLEGFFVDFLGPDPRSNRYLQHFSGVRHFSQSQEMYQKRPPNNNQDDTKNATKGLQKCIQKPRQKTT